MVSGRRGAVCVILLARCESKAMIKEVKIAAVMIDRAVQPNHGEEGKSKKRVH